MSGERGREKALFTWKWVHFSVFQSGAEDVSDRSMERTVPLSTSSCGHGNGRGHVKQNEIIYLL